VLGVARGVTREAARKSNEGVLGIGRVHQGPSQSTALKYWFPVQSTVLKYYA
jgi:hypothetical protein